MFMNKEIGSLKVSELLNEDTSKWYPRYQKWKRKLERKEII